MRTKRITAMLLALAMLALCACGKHTEPTTKLEQNTEVADDANDVTTEETTEDTYAEESEKPKERKVTLVSISDEPISDFESTYQISEYFDGKVGMWQYQIDAAGPELLDSYEIGSVKGKAFVDVDNLDTDDIVDPTDTFDTHNLNEDEYDTYFADYHRDANSNEPGWFQVMESDNGLRIVNVYTQSGKTHVTVREHLGKIYENGEPVYYLSKVTDLVADWVKLDDEVEFEKAVSDILNVDIDITWE